MTLVCANRNCELPPLTTADARIEIKAVLPKGWFDIERTTYVTWQANGEAAFHVTCWRSVVRVAKSRVNRSGNSLTMKQTEKIMIEEASETKEIFDSEQDMKKAAKKAAAIILSSKHCIAFTGAGISTSSGLGDFRGKSGKWTEEDQLASNEVVNAAFQKDKSEAESSCAKLSTQESKKKVFPTAEEEEMTCQEEAEEETVDYESLRPTYTHEALSLLVERGLICFIISQNCDGLHRLAGLSPERIAELHGNVFVEKCSKCAKRHERNFYVLHDEASQYYEDIEDYGKTDLRKPKFAVKCDRCGLCHRTGRRCRESNCNGFLEDTIINFGDNLEDDVLDLAMDEARLSTAVLCLGTTLTVTPASDIVKESKGSKPLILCNRQKTEKENLAQVRVFGDCDVFMEEVLAELIGQADKKEWEDKRGTRMKEYDTKRVITSSRKRRSSTCVDTARVSMDTKGSGQKKK